MKAYLKDNFRLSEFRNLTFRFFEMVRNRNELLPIRNRSIFTGANSKPAQFPNIRKIPLTLFKNQQQSIFEFSNQIRLNIRDPLNPTNNVGRSTFNLYFLRWIMSQAYVIICINQDCDVHLNEKAIYPPKYDGYFWLILGKSVRGAAVF